jgi:hypothetical protein
MVTKITDLTAKERRAVKFCLSLLTTDRYFQRYYEIVGPDVTATDAFYQLEAEVLELTGQNRFTSFESFRQKRHHYCRRLQQRRGNP